MGPGDARDADVRSVVALAEAVEQASRDGHPVVWLLDDLDEATDRTCRRLSPASPVEAADIERWRGVVGSVRRAVATGRVRSVSGLAREARRFAVRVEPRDHFVSP